jgi:hypothetical protein
MTAARRVLIYWCIPPLLPPGPTCIHQALTPPKHRQPTQVFAVPGDRTQVGTARQAQGTPDHNTLPIPGTGPHEHAQHTLDTSGGA